MPDIFDNQILCNECGKPMKKEIISKNGFNLRAVKCDRCNEIIVHPSDKQEYENFMKLKQKEFNVKMRMVGNSYAVSIPREIVDFMQEQEKVMNNMVRMCFNNANSLNLMFGNQENMENEENNQNHRIIKAREVHVVKNNKPILHLRQVSDSHHPERNQTKIFKANKLEDEEEE